ncbi:hypothetical protein OSM86_25515, partial [Escherichia coli]|nr:hypothetical protein [Escherichia coli]
YEKIADEYGDRLTVAKVNIDEEAALAEAVQKTNLDTTEGTDDQEDRVRNLSKRRETAKCQGSCRRSRGESEYDAESVI